MKSQKMSKAGIFFNPIWVLIKENVLIFRCMQYCSMYNNYREIAALAYNFQAYTKLFFYRAVYIILRSADYCYLFFIVFILENIIMTIFFKNIEVYGSYCYKFYIMIIDPIHYIGLQYYAGSMQLAKSGDSRNNIHSLLSLPCLIFAWKNRWKKVLHLFFHITII